MKIVFNEDQEKVKSVLEALKQNGGYCPCSLIQNEDTKCRCKDFREQTTPGLCHCELYRKIED